MEILVFASLSLFVDSLFFMFLRKYVEYKMKNKKSLIDIFYAIIHNAK